MQIVDVNWTDTPAQAAAANATPPRLADQAAANGKLTRSERADAGYSGSKTYHYYCSSDQGQPTMSFSASFDMNDPSPRNIGEAFQAFIARKYGYKSANQLPCFGNNTSLADIQADERKRMHDLSASGKWRVVDTGWVYRGP
jgi:hypothetical protein